MLGKETEGGELGRELRWLVTAATVSLVVGGCSQTPQPVKAAEPNAAEAAAQAAIADAEATSAQAAAGSPPAAPVQGAPPQSLPTQPPSQPAQATSPPERPGLVVIDPGGEGDGEVNIVAAARAERERRASAPPVSRVITNKTLVKSPDGKKGKQPAAKAGTKPAPAQDAARSALPDGKDEEYWRTRSRELRLEWKEAVDQIAELERDADGLRRRFYAESDPYVRDTRIKPDWDRVLDRIREVKDDATRRREQLAAHLEEGRRAGALPGWLREGLDLEPRQRDQAESDRDEAIEPPPYPEPIGDPPV